MRETALVVAARVVAARVIVLFLALGDEKVSSKKVSRPAPNG
jgi:hypothetical protein